MPNSIVIDPKGEQTEFQGPVSRYEVVESKPAASDQRFIASELDAPTEDAVAAPAKTGTQAGVARQTKTEKSGANAAKGTKLVIFAGVGFGLLGGLALAVMFTRPAPQDGSTDMGAVTSTATGLKGQLMTNWGDRLNYKLTMQPSDPSYQAGFTNAVNNPAHPLQVDLQLKNASGSVLCDSPILLKYDPMKTSASTSADAETAPTGKGKKIDEISVDQAQVAQALNNARLVGQELDREHGKDIFQSNVGQDGRVTSISAQGTLPCSRKQYEHAASWSFTSNFPVVVQLAKGNSADSIDDDDLADPNVDSQPSTYQQRMIAARRKIAMPVSHFSVEEDDEAVNFVASNGTLETQSGKQLQMEKRDQVALALKGVDLPVRIHYRCDQFGACAVAGLGSGIQRAWLER